MHSLALESSISDLEHFLLKEKYYDASNEDVEEINQQILKKWDDPIKEAISNDFTTHLNNTTVEKITNLFDLSADQGATVFISFVTISDDHSNESLRIIIKAIVGHNKILTYLDSLYANDKIYSGNSKLLANVFSRLKEADKQFGYFNPISFRSLLEDKQLLA